MLGLNLATFKTSYTLSFRNNRVYQDEIWDIEEGIIISDKGEMGDFWISDRILTFYRVQNVLIRWMLNLYVRIIWTTIKGYLGWSRGQWIFQVLLYLPLLLPLNVFCHRKRAAWKITVDALGIAVVFQARKECIPFPFLYKSSCSQSHSPKCVFIHRMKVQYFTSFTGCELFFSIHNFCYSTLVKLVICYKLENLKNLEKNIIHNSTVYIKHINMGVYIIQVFSVIYVIFRLCLYKSY